jgi:hypothetical protein
MSATRLQRLLAARSVALIGGAWADAPLRRKPRDRPPGEIWRIHLEPALDAEQHYFRSVDELPAAPDAAFIAAPNAMSRHRHPPPAATPADSCASLPDSRDGNCGGARGSRANSRPAQRICPSGSGIAAAS